LLIAGVVCEKQEANVLALPWLLAFHFKQLTAVRPLSDRKPIAPFFSFRLAIGAHIRTILFISMGGR
jgi:hypothetical protein